MTDLYSALLSWAVTLSGYPAPAEPPVIVQKPHAFFVQQACHGQECKVLGWYAGGRNLYIDNTLDPENNLFASSIVVHEMVHYLQGVARGDDVLRNGAAFSVPPTCDKVVQWEREAYAVQREYILRYGAFMPIGTAMTHVQCDQEGAVAHNGQDAAPGSAH